MVVVAASLGALAGLGLLVLIAGLTGRQVLDLSRRTRIEPHAARSLALRTMSALGGGGAAVAATGWPVLGVAAAIAGYWMPTIWGTRGRTRLETDRVEAIATWTEQLRDVLGGASGLHSALIATAALSPLAIRPETERLAARLEYERTSSALRKFADDVHHPVADFVVAALVVAADNEARNLAGLLGRLADTAREEARLRTKVWVSRARIRTSLRVIATVIPVMVGAVMLVDRHYLDPYNSASGQIALAATLVVFAIAYALMSRTGRIRLPERFLLAEYADRGAS